MIKKLCCCLSIDLEWCYPKVKNHCLYFILFVLFTALGNPLTAQNPNFELSSQSTFTPTVTGTDNFSTTVNFVKNGNNPTGNTFTPYSPPLQMTVSVSNQQYPNIYNSTSGNDAVVIGYINPNHNGLSYNNPAVDFFGRTSFISESTNSSYFTSAGATTPGTGYRVIGNADPNSNYGVYLSTFVNGIPNNLINTGKVYMADITISFNRPVKNPRIDFTGLGVVRVGDNPAMVTEFEMIESNVPIALSKISGNARLRVVGNIIDHTGTSNNNINSTNNAAFGTVQFTGTGIEKIVLKTTIRSGAGTSWGSTGDGFMISSSVLESDLEVTKTVNDSFPAPGDTITFTITANNKGISNNTNVSVTDLLSNGFTFVSASATAGSYSVATGKWTIGTLNENTSETLTIQAVVNDTGTHDNSASITGDVGDPDTNNNISSVSISPKFCYRKATITGTGLPTIHGITALGRAGKNPSEWPNVRSGAWTALEAKTKGFVINRVAANPANAVVNPGQVPTSIIAEPVKGMIVYDTTNHCMKIYTGTSWKCFNQQTCAQP